MWVTNYIQSEVERQHSTLFTEFEQAFNLAKLTSHVHGYYEFVKFVQAIAAHVEPDVNVWRLAGDRYVNTRLSEVGFLHTVSQAPPASEVQHRFQRWAGFAWEESFLPTEATTDPIIKQLLDIHPWADGNGRTASILRNWMLGTMDDPTPLPYYYGEA